ncbi:SOS response-associated peptidase [Microbacterium sp. AK031]|uniref:SOS response-associated peptidase n=1 Tax=Microbacterium sp. AK031 TaxID=2723076 RepID=UPI0021686FA0|nr:SOS response-associated peptidase [Microbacterium sp. AK031]MCS3845050.1 putative SOS response-associated peptidase YedK [Microbacterium sp. AK031]
MDPALLDRTRTGDPDRAGTRESGDGEFQRSVDAAIWDFRPAFMKNSKRPNCNTRIETVATNGWCKGAFASSRALFPMRGYFEWTGTAGKKRPHILHSASIITRPARDASGEIHDRMPVFLESPVCDEYLSPDKLDGAGKQDMIQLLTLESDRVAGRITVGRTAPWPTCCPEAFRCPPHGLPEQADPVGAASVC